MMTLFFHGESITLYYLSCLTGFQLCSLQDVRIPVVTEHSTRRRRMGGTKTSDPAIAVCSIC